MENALTDLLPRSMIPVVLRRLEIDPAMQANSLTRQKRRAMVELLKAFSVEITGKRPVAEAIITSGGIKVSEINPKTMESKLIKMQSVNLIKKEKSKIHQNLNLF